jgi:hypothetical protein
MSADDENRKLNSASDWHLPNPMSQDSASSDIKGTLDEILRQLQCVNVRVSRLELEVHSVNDQSSSFAPRHPSPVNDVTPTPHPSPADVGADFHRIRNSVQSVRLPHELSLHDSRQGIKRDDLPLYNLLVKSARFTETALKVLANNGGSTAANSEESSQQNVFTDLFTVLYAHMQFIQEEYAALVVQSSFDPTVSRFFRSLQRNSGFSAEAMDNLRSAASIASVYRPQQQRGNRGGQRFNRYEGRRDGFQTYQAARGFPSRGGSVTRRSDYASAPTESNNNSN